MSKPERGIHFQPRAGILDSLGVTKAEFDQAVFRAFLEERDCHYSPDDVRVVFGTRDYRLAEVAHVQVHQSL